MSRLARFDEALMGKEKPPPVPAETEGGDSHERAGFVTGLGTLSRYPWHFKSLRSYRVTLDYGFVVPHNSRKAGGERIAQHEQASTV